MAHAIDPLELGRALIRCPSVTPADAGALDVLEGVLKGLGFACHRLRFGEGKEAVDNLYARHGTGHPNFCFAGHTDVVPVGAVDGWSVDPFGAEIRDGRLWGRGASDMKCAIACFAAAAERFLARRGGALAGSVSLLITGDEEAAAVNGTAKVLEWMTARGERIDACLVGEPTNPEALGDMIKIGRRGSMSGFLTVHGRQGHSAYPHLADNPLPRLVRMLAALDAMRLDDGTEHFQPSTLALTSIDVGNAVSNVIPAKARAVFNIRFNDRHTSASLKKRLADLLDGVGGAYDLDFMVTGEAFLTPPGPLSEVVADAVRAVTGRTPELSTTGGTSDARFIKDHCPVAEFGIVGQTMHKVDENIAIADVPVLTAIYEGVLERFFPGGAGAPC